MKKKCDNIKKLFRKYLDKFKKKFLVGDRDRGFFSSIFQDFLNKNNIKIYSRDTSFGEIYAERFYCAIRDVLKRPVFEKCNANWIDVLPIITKQHKNRIKSSNKLTLIQASLKKNEGFVHQKVLGKRKKIKPKFQLNDFFRTADFEEIVFKIEFN